MTTCEDRLRRGVTFTAAAFAILALLLLGPATARAQWTTSGTNINNTNTGNVGAGTNSPSAALHVKGNLFSQLTGTVSVTQNSATVTGTGTSFTTQFGPGDSIKVGNEVFTVSSISSNTVLTLDSNYLGASASGLTAFRDPNLFAVDNGDGVNKLTVSRSGQVGVGVASPGVPLDVSGAAAPNSFILRVANTVQGGEIFQAVNNLGNEVGSLRTDTAANGFFTVNDGSGTRKVQLTSYSDSYLVGGNVGIGTTTPVYKLDIAGQVRSSSGGFVFPDGTTQATAASSVTFGSTAGTAIQGNTTLTVTAGAGMSGGGTATLGSGGTLTLTNNDKGSAQNIFKNVGNAAGATQFSAASNTDTLRFEGTGGTTVSFDSTNKKVVINSSSASPSGWTDAGTSVSLTNSAAKVGIGTTTAPLQRLQIGGNTPTGTTTPDAISLGATYSSAPRANPKLMLFDDNAGSVYGMGSSDHQFDFMVPALARYVWSVGGAEKMRLDASGNLGIGTTPNSAYRLDVAGSVNASGGLCINGACKSNWSEVGGSQWTTPDGSGNFNTAPGVGNVGVGVANPTEKLTVAGSIVANGSSAIPGSQFIITNNDTTGPWMGVHTDRLGNSTANYAAPRLSVQAAGMFFQFSPATPAGSARTWTTRLAINSSDGNVGIGTSTPGARLDVVQANAAAVRALSGSASAHVSIQLGRTAAEVSVGVAAGPGQYTTDADTGDVVLRTEDATKRLLVANGPGASALAVSGSKVGIGKNNPGVALDVVGAINATGAITGATVSATYQDVAEWVPSTQRLAAGTVVVLDGDKTNHVLASTSAYDTKVAGVISDSPGVILGVGGDDKLKVATTGRVRVKVDATRAPIKVGDLLVTSETEGVAMKSVEVDLGGVKIHRPGTIIGKALEPLASGTGEILVLLSLQ